MTREAPAFHCPDCDSINFQFRDTCLNCGFLFNDEDYNNKPTKIDRIMGPLIESRSKDGYPILTREIHILKDYDTKSGGSIIEKVNAEAPAKEKFTEVDRLKFELAQERKKNKKSKSIFSMFGFQ